MSEAVSEAFLIGTSLNPVLERLLEASVRDCPLAVVAIVSAKYKVASQEAKTGHETKTPRETETLWMRYL